MFFFFPRLRDFSLSHVVIYSPTFLPFRSFVCPFAMQWRSHPRARISPCSRRRRQPKRRTKLRPTGGSQSQSQLSIGFLDKRDEENPVAGQRHVFLLFHCDSQPVVLVAVSAAASSVGCRQVLPMFRPTRSDIVIE